MISTFRKVLDLFGPGERLRLFGIFGLALITALIQTSSVASVMPFMAVVGDPSIIDSNPFLARLYDWVGAETHSSFLVVLGLGVMGVLFTSSLLSGVTTWVTLRFVWRTHDEICRRLLGRYLAQPYTWFLQRNTTHLSKNLLTEAATVSRGVLVPTLEVGVQAMVALFIVAFLVYLDPLLAVATAVVLGGGYVALWHGVKVRQAEIGREQVDLNTDRYRYAGEAFGGIKELKVLGREKPVARRFGRVNSRFSAITVTQEMISRVPRNVMEVVAFGGILLVTIYLLASRAGIGHVLPVLSAFALGGYKLMPALQAVFAGLTNVRFHAASLDDLHRDLFGPVGAVAEAGRYGDGAVGASDGEEAREPRVARSGGEDLRASGSRGPEEEETADRTVAARSAAGPREASPTPDRSLPGEHAGAEGKVSAESSRSERRRTLKRDLRLRNLTYRYPGSDEPVLKAIDLEVRRGEMVGLVGPTGSGKTTVVDIVLGLLPVEPDRFLLDGEPITSERLALWRRTLGYVPQEIFLSDESVARNIALGLPDEEVDRDRVEEAARLAHIHDFVAGLPRRYDTVVGERGVRLSGGQRQRIGIARALYDGPPFLVFDEGTSALDGATEAAVTEALRALEPPRTFLWIAHRLRTLEESDRIYLLDEGRVVATGTHDELMRTEPRFRAMARAGSEE